MSLMKDFFKQELKTVQLKTGIRQLENIMNVPEWETQLEKLISLMVDEVNKPPFDLIGIDLKQRIISTAIIEDKDFIGLNPKFIRRTLNIWWASNKDKYYEKITHSENSPAHNPVSWDERSKWLDVWRDSLDKITTAFTSGPKLTRSEIITEGQEKIKQEGYPSTPESFVKKKLLHDQWIKECFDTYTGEPNEYYIEESEWLKHQRQLDL